MTTWVRMLAVVFAVGGAAQLGAAVVCVGSDGHIGVESLLDQCCISAATLDDRGGSRLMSATSSCGDCVDVQLSVPLSKSRETRLCSSEIIAEVRSFAPSRDSDCAELFALPSLPIDQRPLSLAPVTTIVLLT